MPADAHRHRCRPPPQPTPSLVAAPRSLNNKAPLMRASRQPSSLGAVSVTLRGASARLRKRPTRPAPESTSGGGAAGRTERHHLRSLHSPPCSKRMYRLVEKSLRQPNVALPVECGRPPGPQPEQPRQDFSRGDTTPRRAVAQHGVAEGMLRGTPRHKSGCPA